MGLFGRLLSRRAKHIAQRRETVYDPYERASADDNPYLTEYATGFVYKTLEFAMLSTWMMVNSYDELIPDTLENIVLGMDSKIGDPDELIESCKGYVFELIRLTRVSLEVDTDPYSMPILTSDEGREVTESVSRSARAFIGAVMDGEDENAMRIAVTASTPGDPWPEEELVPVYLMFITTVLTLVTREWFCQTFPEFDYGSEDADSVNE